MLGHTTRWRERYIFLSDTTVLCCNVEITVPLGFEDEESARETIRHEGHLKSYELQTLPSGSEPTKH